MFTKPKASTTARGYGATHQQLRAMWAPKVATGQVRCWRCGQPIRSSEPWDLGHDDTDRTITRGPEHRHRTRTCPGNRGAGAIKVNRKRKATVQLVLAGAVTPRCPQCSRTLTHEQVAAGNRYCSQRCGYLAHKDDPPRAKAVRTPKPPPKPKCCAMCGQPVPKGRSRHCSDACVSEYNARAARERYRVAQDLPSTWDRPVKTASRW